jgi:hypothetical protein
MLEFVKCPVKLVFFADISGGGDTMFLLRDKRFPVGSVDKSLVSACASRWNRAAGVAYKIVGIIPEDN